MLKIPKEHLIDKIKAEKGLSDSEINTKVKEKMEQLQGLISEEGAVHIIANELGIKILENTSEKLQIKNVFAGMRNIEVVGKVTRVFEVRHFETPQRKGKVGNFMMGDETGAMRVVCWGDKADILEKLEEGAVIQIKSGYARENSGRVEIHLNDNSAVIINPEGESVGEVKTRSPTTRKKINDLSVEDQNVELLGTIVQSFEPRFFEVCKECGKRARKTDDGLMCEEHGAVAQPDYSYVMNTMLDDGSETIRTIFFKNQMQHLLNKTHEEILAMRDQNFEDQKTDLLGQIIKVIGRVVQNDMFARIEFITQIVEANPNPEDELKELEKTAETAAETPAEPLVTESEETQSGESVDADKPEEVSFEEPKKDAPVDEEIKSANGMEMFEKQEEPKEPEQKPLFSDDEDDKSEEETISLDDLEDMSDDDIYE